MDAYLVGLIAVAGTLLGALTAGLFQYLATRRQLHWQAQDAEQRRRAEREHWAHTAIEERQRTLWAERRRAYGALLTASEGWTEGDRQQARDNYTACLRDVELIGHESVIPLARTVRDALDRGEETAEIKERLGLGDALLPDQGAHTRTGGRGPPQRDSYLVGAFATYAGRGG